MHRTVQWAKSEAKLTEHLLHWHCDSLWDFGTHCTWDHHDSVKPAQMDSFALGFAARAFSVNPDHLSGSIGTCSNTNTFKKKIYVYYAISIRTLCAGLNIYQACTLPRQILSHLAYRVSDKTWSNNNSQFWMHGKTRASWRHFNYWRHFLSAMTKVGRSWRLEMCFRCLLCVRIEIDQLYFANCWVIMHCLSVSCT